MSLLTDRQKKVLDNWADMGFTLFALPQDSKRKVSEIVGGLVARQAVRSYVAKDDLGRWLQVAYGAIWVRRSGLVPGLDLQELKKIMYGAYDEYQRGCV